MRPRLLLRGALCATLAVLTAACAPEPPLVIGRPGTSAGGEFRHPRGVAVSEHGLAVLDRTGRLQFFDLDGTFRSLLTITPGDVRRGHPVGLAWLHDGRIAIADTHQSRVRLIDPATAAEQVLGDYGLEPGQYLCPQRIAADGAGRLIVSDHGMGSTNRIQVVQLDGTAVRVFGGPAPADGGLVRPMGVVALPGGDVLVSDQRAGIVRYAADGACRGTLPGWPFGDEVLVYGLARSPDGTLYCTDLEGHRVLRLAADGTPTGVLGGRGSEPGLFLEPWDVAWYAGFLYVADMGNHRVQRFAAERADWREP